jgi:hypothetical protein
MVSIDCVVRKIGIPLSWGLVDLIMKVNVVQVIKHKSNHIIPSLSSANGLESLVFRKLSSYLTDDGY